MTGGMVGGGRVGRTITDPPIVMSAQALGDFVFGVPHPLRLALYFSLIFLYQHTNDVSVFLL